MSSAQVSAAPVLLPSTPSDFAQFISRPPLYRGDSQDTFVGAESAFDAASTICATPHRTTRYYIQVRSPALKKYKNWVLCYATLLSAGEHTFVHLIPSDEGRDVTSPPRVLLQLQGSALRIARSRLFIASANVNAVARAFDLKGSLQPPTPEMSWAFAGFGLASSLDDQAKGFSRAVCEAMDWPSLDRHGAPIVL